MVRGGCALMGMLGMLGMGVIGSGCGPQTALDKGTMLWSDPALSPASSNVFSCATCHSAQKDGDPGRVLAGYTLHDTVARGAWWCGSYNALLDAVNECYVEFLRGRKLAKSDENGRALLVYLESISPDAKADALPLTVVATLNATYYDSLAGGDKTRGAMLYQKACGNCHGALHTGSGRLGRNVSLIPDESIAAHGSDPVTGARAITIEKVRHGKFFTVGGNMPLFSLEALADADLKDILAYMGF